MVKKVLRIVGIIIFVIGLFAVVGAIYLYNNGLSGKYTNTEPKKEQIKVACVGDSITYGHGISDWEKNNYPAVLQRLLGGDYHVANFGSSGACVNPNGDQPYIGREVYQESLDYDADIIVFMIGTNDSKPENWVDTESFIKNYQELLSSYMTNSDKQPRIYIGLCAEGYYSKECDPSTGIAEYDIQPAFIDEIVEEIKEYAQLGGYNVEVIDIHSLTEAHPEWFEKDGIHPNNDGARAIAEAVADAIK